MTGTGNQTAFDRLLEYERRAADFQPRSREGHGPADEWNGVVFGVGGFRMTCHIDRIGEILPCPPSTPVPGAKSWIIGLANVRGELVTVVDLVGFLSGTPARPGSSNRLLSASLNKAPVGLLVDEVFGQRHFLDSDAMPAELDEDSPLRGVVTRKHVLGPETWFELDLDRLFTSPEFLHGAAE
jgi:twitching motility protein PilI